MIDTTLRLISPATRVQDEDGIWRTVGETAREILAQEDSIGRSEFFAAGQSGFRPERRFTVFAGEYRGEAACEYGGTRYAIYRTYHVPGTDYLELYAQREGGVHNGAQNGA